MSKEVPEVGRYKDTKEIESDEDLETVKKIGGKIWRSLKMQMATTHLPDLGETKDRKEEARLKVHSEGHEDRKEQRGQENDLAKVG